MTTVVNPLDLYGPYIPVSFEPMPSASMDTQEIQEMIDASVDSSLQEALEESLQGVTYYQEVE